MAANNTSRNNGRRREELEAAAAATAAANQMNGQQQPWSLGVMEWMQDNWQLTFMMYSAGSAIYSAINRRKRGESTVQTLVKELLAIVAVMFISMKLERLITRNMVNPLMQYLFGDGNDRLRNEVEQAEAELRERIQELKRQRETNQVSEEVNERRERWKHRSRVHPSRHSSQHDGKPDITILEEPKSSLEGNQEV